MLGLLAIKEANKKGKTNEYSGVVFNDLEKSSCKQKLP